jgi:hypothetical protein
LYLENDPADGSFKPGEYTVPVLFSSNLEASPIPVVKPVYISVDDPIIPIGAGYRAAKLSFNLDDKGSVTQVDVQDGGNYTNKPIIVIRENGKGAILEPTWNENTGGIESVTVVKGGQGYTTSSNIGVLLLSKKEKIQLDPVIDNYGIFNNIILTNPGYGYLMDYKPNISITSAIKDAKIPTIDLVINQYSYKVTLAYLKSNGSGFKNVLNYPSSKNNINLTKENTLSSLDTKYIKDIYLGTGKR